MLRPTTSEGDSSAAGSSHAAAAAATAAKREAEEMARRLDSTPQLRLTVCRALKKLVGAAINSVQGNDAALVRAAGDKLVSALGDPLGRRGHAPGRQQSAFGRDPFNQGASSSSGAVSKPNEPLCAAYGDALAAVPEATDDAFRLYVAHYASSRLLDRLLDDTFDPKRDVWGLAALAARLVADVAAVDMRRVLQGHLIAAAPDVAAPGALESRADDDAAAHKPEQEEVAVAAFLAALAALPESAQRDAPFGGVAAAWTWLARAANRLASCRWTALPAVVSFLEVGGAVLLRAFDAPFLRLLDRLRAGLAHQATTPGGGGGGGVPQGAAIKLRDLCDRAAARSLEPPDGLQALYVGGTRR